MTPTVGKGCSATLQRSCLQMPLRGSGWLVARLKVTLFAVAGCHGGCGCWVPLLDAGCHGKVPCGGVPLLGANSVPLLGAIAGYFDSLDVVPCWMPL